MNLWIRSQSCENLINNPLRIHYEIGYNEEHRIYANTYDECILIGKYATKERALEVMDEIQNIVKPIIIYKQDKPIETIQDGFYQIKQDVNEKIHEFSSYVYEMPKY